MVLEFVILGLSPMFAFIFVLIADIADFYIEKIYGLEPRYGTE